MVMRREAPTRVITVPQSDESPEHGLWMPMDMDDPDMLELFDALDVERLETNVENALVTNASPDVIPPLPLRDQGQPPPCPAVPMGPPSRRPAATPTTSATATEEPRPLRTANRTRQECQHHRRTAAGSNSFIHQIKCKDCGVVLFRTPADAAATPTTSSTTSTCPHHWTTWRGSNRARTVVTRKGSQWILLAEQCPPEERPKCVKEHSRSRLATTTLRRQRQHQHGARAGNPTDLPGLIMVMRRIQELERGTEVPSQRLHEALDLSKQRQLPGVHRWARPRGPLRQPELHPPRDHLEVSADMENQNSIQT